MMNGLSISLLFIMLLPIFIIMTFIPYWTRKTESFGVSIPEHVYNDPNLQSLRKGYVYRTVILSVFHTLILLILFLMTNFTEQTLITFYSVSIFMYLIISFFIYLIYHRKMKELKQYKGWFRERKQQTFIYTKFREQKLTVSHYLFAIPFILSLITIGWTLMNYDLFPNKIPMNYSLTGEVTNWVEKSYRSILLMPSTQFILTIIFVAVNIVISRAKQQVSATNPEESLQRNIIFRRRWSTFLFATNIALTFMFIVAQISFAYYIHPTILMIVFVVTTMGIIGGSIILSVTTGQGGSRIKLATHEATTDVIDRDDDQYWKLGQFYFNKDDPTLFLEKRFGIGWSINFARPAAWLLFLGVIILAVGIPLLLSL